MKTIGEILKAMGILIVIIFMGSFVQKNIVTSKQSEPQIKYKNVYLMYSETNLNIRKGPNTNTEILKTLKPNDKVITYDTTINGFLMILNTDSTQYGWASRKYLQSEPLSKKQLSASNSQTAKTGKEFLNYKIIKKQKVGLSTSSRMVYRILVEVDKIPSDDAMKKTAIHIWKDGNRGWNEFTVFIYLPEMDLNYSAYGIIEFNPNGITSFSKSESNFYGTKWKAKK